MIVGMMVLLFLVDTALVCPLLKVGILVLLRATIAETIKHPKLTPPCSSRTRRLFFFALLIAASLERVPRSDPSSNASPSWEKYTN